MTRVPRLAVPVVLVIRREAPAPPKRLRRYFNGMFLRFRGGRDPMGLCSLAKSPVPMRAKQFPYPGITTRSVRSFFLWWDGLRDSKEAVEAVWRSELGSG